MWEDLDDETREAARAHVRKLERLALTERKTTERGKDAVRSLALMAYLAGWRPDSPLDDDGEPIVSAEVIELVAFRKAA